MGYLYILVLFFSLRVITLYKTWKHDSSINIRDETVIAYFPRRKKITFCQVAKFHIFFLQNLFTGKHGKLAKQGRKTG